MYVNKTEIERVRRSNDLVAVVESRGVPLTRKGRNYVGLCPFHDDKDPSLVVNPERQLWNCFGACRGNGGKSGGDVFAFVSRMEGISFTESLRRLGYEEPKPSGGNGKNKNKKPRRKPADALPDASTKESVSEPPTSPALFHADLLGRVASHYHRTFRESTEGQDYLKSRGLNDPEMFSAFEVGYVDGSLRKTFDLDGKTAQALKEVGILNARGREHFLGCVVFPLTLPDIGTVGFYGRHVTRDRHLYLPGPRSGVFHRQAFQAGEEVILTESVIDALTLYQSGFRNVSCVYGTQGFVSDHEELLRRTRVRRVLLCLDNDDAGNQATETTRERIGKLGIDVEDIRVAGAKDPNELYLSLGSDEFQKRVAASLPLTVKATGKERNHGDGEPHITTEPGGGRVISFASCSYRVRGLTPTGLDRLRVNLRVECVGRMHLDTLDLYSHRSRCGLVKELASLFGRDEGEVTRELAVLIETLETIRLDMAKNDKESSTEAAKAAASAAAVAEIPDRERREALSLLRKPNLLETILDDFARAGFVGERTALSVGYLGTISRLLDRPLGLLIVSRSGAGKSSLEDALCDFVPEEALAKYTRLTGQALFYKGEDSLAHKVLAIEEEQGAAEAGYSIRTLQSAQVLTIAATKTDPQTGRLCTEEYRVEGPVFILLTTTSPEALDYETRNRFVQVGIDESAEQTRRILQRQREADTLDGILRREEGLVLRRLHRNLQRLLRPLQVVNPFAPYLSYPDERLQMRREQKKYLTLIKSIALLHQHQREIKRASRNGLDVEYIEVEPADITLANRLAREVLGHGIDELAHPTRQLLKQLVEMTRSKKPGVRCFTRRDIRTWTGWNDWQVRVHLGKLLELEYVVLATGRNGRLMSYELLFDGDPEGDRRYLAGLVDIEALLEAQESGNIARGCGTGNSGHPKKPMISGPCEHLDQLVSKTESL